MHQSENDSINVPYLEEITVLKDILQLDINHEGGCYLVDTPKGDCKHCHKSDCKKRYVNLNGHYIQMSCDKSPGSTAIEMIPYDYNILSYVTPDLVDDLIKNARQYLTDPGRAMMIKRIFGSVIRHYGGVIYIYNTTTRLWFRYWSIEQAALIISIYIDKILNHIILKFSKKPTAKESVEKSVEEAREKIVTSLTSLKNQSIKVGKITSSLKGMGMMFLPFEEHSGSAYYLPIFGGKVIDLRTGNIEDRAPHHFFTFECPVTYLPDDPCVHITKFMEDLFINKDEVEYMQEHLGYLLSGSIEARSFYIFWGNTKNGKSTLLEDLMQKILGKYFVTLMRSALNPKQSGATPELVPLLGARLAMVSETNQNEKIDEALLKRMTDGELTVRQLYKETITFKNRAKIVMATNCPPDISSQAAIVGRTKFIPFRRTFLSEEDFNNTEANDLIKLQDPKFINQLQTTYLNEVFTYFANGAIRFFKNNGNRELPESFNAALTDFIHDNDYFAKFLDERTIKNINTTTRSKTMLDAYKDWAEMNNEKKLNSKSLKAALMEKGFEYKRRKDGMHILNIELKPLDIAFI